VTGIDFDERLHSTDGFNACALFVDRVRAVAQCEYPGAPRILGLNDAARAGFTKAACAKGNTKVGRADEPASFPCSVGFANGRRPQRCRALR